MRTPRGRRRSTMCWPIPNGGSACRRTSFSACRERRSRPLTLPLAVPPFVAGEAGAVARAERDRRQPDLHMGEIVAVRDREQARAEFPHPVGGELAELALGDGQRLPPDPGRGLAKAELRIEGGEAVIGLRRIEIEIARPVAPADAAEIALQRRIGRGQLAIMMGEDGVVIRDGPQIGRELALQRRDVEARPQVPEQVRAIFGRGRAGQRQADEWIAALDRRRRINGRDEEDLRRRGRRRGESERGKHGRSRPLQNRPSGYAHLTLRRKALVNALSLLGKPGRGNERARRAGGSARPGTYMPATLLSTLGVVGGGGAVVAALPALFVSAGGGGSGAMATDSTALASLPGVSMLTLSTISFAALLAAGALRLQPDTARAAPA